MSTRVGTKLEHIYKNKRLINIYLTSMIIIPYPASKKEIKKYNKDILNYFRKLFISILICGIVIEPIFIIWMITDMKLSSVMDIILAILLSQMIIVLPILGIAVIFSYVWLVLDPQ